MPTDPAVEAAERLIARYGQLADLPMDRDDLIAAAREALATIRALHKPSSHPDPEDRHCIECGWAADWPCDTARLAYREDEP